MNYENSKSVGVCTGSSINFYLGYSIFRPWFHSSTPTDKEPLEKAPCPGEHLEFQSKNHVSAVGRREAGGRTQKSTSSLLSSSWFFMS